MAKKARRVTFAFDKQSMAPQVIDDGIEIDVRDPATGQTKKMLIPKMEGKCPACGQLIHQCLTVASINR